MEIDFVQGLTELAEQPFHLRVAGHALAETRLRRRRGRRLPGIQQRQAHLVGQHLHRRGQVERAECRVGGDMHRHVAQLQLLVGQAGALAAEHHRHLGRTGRVGDRAGGGIGRQQLLQLDPARARRAAQHQGAVGDRLGQSGVDRRAIQHVLSPGRAAVGLVVGGLLRCHQHQPAEAHGLHGTGGRTDIAGVLGTDQDETDRRGNGRDGLHERAIRERISRRW